MKIDRKGILTVGDRVNLAMSIGYGRGKVRYEWWPSTITKLYADGKFDAESDNGLEFNHWTGQWTKVSQ